MKKIWIIILFICLGAHDVTAQESSYQVSGVLKGNDGKPVDYNEITASSPMGVVIQRVLTDSVGAFSLTLKSGRYKLTSRRFGSVLFEKDVAIFQDLYLGIITVDNSKILDGVVISGRKI